MTSEYQENMLLLQAVLDFLQDHKENPERYELLTPEVLHVLLNWSIDYPTIGDTYFESGQDSTKINKLDDVLEDLWKQGKG